jgi:hypothetical protein
MRLLALAAALFLPALACAQVGRDRRELRQDRRERRDDRRDLVRLEALLADYDRALARKDLGALVRIEDAVAAELRTERVETRVEVARDTAEVRRDRAEVRSERRELRGDVAAGDAAATAGDRHDLRDDRRDLRDDRRDRAVEVGTAQRRGGIAVELASLHGRTAPPELARKRALIAELVGIARAESRQDRRETREDRREIREDRRETWEDRP